MKRVTTARGCPQTRKEMEQRWKRAWDELPQETLQMWIEGIYNNIKEVLRLDGGNEYREGRAAKRSYRGLRLKGVLSPHAYLNANATIFNAETSEGVNGGSEVVDNSEDHEDQEQQ